MAMKSESIRIIKYLKEHNNEDLTSADIADVLDLPKRQVDGSFTALCRKGLGERILSERKNSDGTHDKVKYLKLNEEGMAFNPEEKLEISDKKQENVEEKMEAIEREG